MSEAASKDRRDKNFSNEEKAVIIDAMTKYNKFLHGKESGSTSKVRKDQILAQIAAEVSGLGYADRTPNKIAKKINDLRRLVKEKVAKINKHRRGTGGGPALKISLTPDEQVIARCLEKEQVEGLEGFQSFDQPLRTGECVLSFIWCVACVWGGGREYVTSVWVHQHVNVLCHP